MTDHLGSKPLRPAIFLDRDGVILRYKRLLTKLEDMELLPDVPEALSRLHDAGYALVLITNQSVVSRGMITEEELQRLHEVLQEKLRAEGAQLDAIYYCPHHPEADDPAYRVACECRKPGTLLMRKAIEDLGLDVTKSFFVGDEERDMEAGRNAGLKTVLISQAPSAISADFVASDLLDASKIITSVTYPITEQ